MKLNEISEGSSPFGKLNALDPSSYGQVFMVSLVILTGVGAASYAFNKLKSVSGAEEVTSPLGGVLGDL